MSKETHTEGLEKRIKTLEARLVTIKTWASKIRQLEDFSMQEKADVFDKLYNQTWTYLKETLEADWYPKDGEYYIYEAVMELTLGKQVWDILNTVQNQ